jgi:hypothetical protein
MALTALLTAANFTTHPLYIVPQSFDGATKIADIILSVQTELAKRCLGDVLYIEFDADFNGSTFDSQLWTDFVDGCIFTFDGRQIKWAGFKDLLKYFVYYEYQIYNRYHQAAIAKVDPTLQNAIVTANFQNEIDMYNRGVDRYGYDIFNMFPDVNRYNLIYYEHDRYKPTAYNFLYNRQNELIEWHFTNKKYFNEIGL